MTTREEKIEAFGKLLDVMDELREKCPWDRKQTNESLRTNTIEETYELCDAIMKNDNKYYLINIDATLINRINSNPIKEMIEMPSNLGVLNADFRTVNENNDIIYYTKGNEVFACNLSTWEETPQNLGIGNGETIS